MRTYGLVGVTNAKSSDSMNEKINQNLSEEILFVSLYNFESFTQGYFVPSSVVVEQTLFFSWVFFGGGGVEFFVPRDKFSPKTGGGLQILTYTRHSWPLISEGI